MDLGKRMTESQLNWLYKGGFYVKKKYVSAIVL